jgi:transcriptional regulator with XRE-family HTH domain
MDHVPDKRVSPNALREFGHRIRSRRMELGVSQEALAATSGLHRTYISSVELGERNISLRNILLLAEALRCDPEELVRGLRG